MSSSLADIVTEFPYPGLRPFEPHEADIFFGRKRHVTELLKRLKSRRFLAVVGPSGCGKSSVIRAGLIPALQAGFMARSKFQWSFAVLRPGNQPLLRLATALRDSGVFGDPDTDAAPDPEQLREDLEAGSQSLANRLSLNEFSQGTNLLILVDQFEELFRFERDGGGDESRAFVNLLLETARDSEVSAYVVITMRTDFLGHCPVFAGLPEALNDSQYLTPRLTREQIEEAVVGPARMFDGDVREDVVARILNEMGTDPDQLPLMQHLLMRMWCRALRHDSLEVDVSSELSRGDLSALTPMNVQLTMADYVATGGLAQALSKHVETVFTERLASERERELAQQMFRRLTGVAPNGQLVRRSPAPEFSGLCDKLSVDDDNELRAVIDTFRVEGRSFLMPPPAEELKPDTPIDISHESLIRNWPRLQEWTRDEARAVKVRREIGKDAAAWDAAGRKSDDTAVPESRLVAALAWSEAHPREVSAQIRDFLEACVCRRDEAHRKDQELARAQRQRLVVSIFATVFLGLAGMVGWLWYQSDQQGLELKAKSTDLEKTNNRLVESGKWLTIQKDITSSALARGYWRDAVQQFQGNTAANGDDLAVGLLWLAEAYSKEPKLDSETKKELYEVRVGAALAQHPKLRQIWHHKGLKAMAASHDGKYVLTAATTQDKKHHELRFWNVDHGKQLQHLNCTHEVNAVEFSGEGNGLYLLAAMGKKEDAKGGLAVWHWPAALQEPQLFDDKPLTDSGPVLAAAFLPAGDSSSKPGVVAIVHVSNDTSKVMLWRALDGMSEELKPAVGNPGHESDDKAMVAAAAFRALTVSPDGRFVGAWGASDEGRGDALHIWNVANQVAIGRDLLAPDAVTRAAFSPTGDLLATVDRRGKARLWNTSTGKVLTDAETGDDGWTAHDGAATDVAFGPDEGQLLTAGEDNVARSWDIDVLRRRLVE